jgi:hypothetical protein
MKCFTLEEKAQRDNLHTIRNLPIVIERCHSHRLTEAHFQPHQEHQSSLQTHGANLHLFQFVLIQLMLARHLGVGIKLPEVTLVTSF